MAIEAYKDLAIFEGLSDAQVESVLTLAEEKHFKKGEFVFQEGQSASHFYVLVSGKVRIQVLLSSRPENLGISILSIPGTLVGWSGLIKGTAYTAAALCEENTELMAIDGAKFMAMLEADTDMGFIIMRKISETIGRRMRTLQQTVLSTL